MKIEFFIYFILFFHLAPPLPDLPDIYETRIEVNYLAPQKHSVSIVHYYDYNRARAAILTQKNNIDTRLIFDYMSDEIHELKSKFIAILRLVIQRFFHS